MIGVRIGSAIVCLVLAVLLVLTFQPGFGPSRYIEPTGGVTDSGPQDDLPSLEASLDVLQARTFLQRWREMSGPAPGGAHKTAITARQGDATPDPVAEEEQ
ncbi:hypothetical protein [Rhodospirillaceae bacterium SYSU D60014]|uniref:hypothetical protein n=1 Tax=Virgifigura deserti TaxID=2268457 RepID=UPI000E66EA19